MARTFVEFFSSEALENIMALLRYKPDNLIFIGQKHNMVTKKINNTRAFVKRVSPSTSLSFLEVSRDNLDSIIKVIDDICDKYPEAEFELTGGAELVLIAYGIVSAKRNLKSLRIDPYTNIEIINNDMNTAMIHPELCMSVEDNIILHGGHMTSTSGRYEWNFTPEFREDIKKVWSVASESIPNWNRTCSEVADAIKRYPSDFMHVFTFPKKAISHSIEILYKLDSIHVLRDFTVSDRSISFKFKNKMIQQILMKIGNILELHVYEVVTRENTIFTNAEIGAVIDWDGKMANHSYDANYDTTNEIDVIAMKNVVPIFISCKIGKADNLALHELETITTRFGGGYARKALVMGQSAGGNVSGQSYFRQRAKDMQIWIIDDVGNMSDEELLKKLTIAYDLN